MQEATGLQLTFVSPSEWMLDETLTPVGVRMKIENGVIFFKPAGAGVTVDVIELHLQNAAWRTELSINHPMIERLTGQLERLGWSGHQPFFELHPAQRGWHGISLRPSRQKPVDRPYVRVRQITAKPAPAPKLHQGPITMEDVARVLCIPL
jgi:hypothetical protein